MNHVSQGDKMKIKYEATENLSETECPKFQKHANEIRMVGSVLCATCDYYLDSDRENKTVECNYE